MLRLIGWSLLIIGVIVAAAQVRGLTSTEKEVGLVQIIGEIDDRRRADLRSALTSIASDLGDIDSVKSNLNESIGLHV